MEMIVEFWSSHSESIIGIGYNALLCLIILFASTIVAKGVRRSIRKAKDRFEKLDATLVPILCATATYVIYIIGGVFILDIFGVNTASIIALLGAAGIAVGLALKDTLSNILPKIMLRAMRQLSCGSSAARYCIRLSRMFPCSVPETRARKRPFGWQKASPIFRRTHAPIRAGEAPE